MTTWTGNKGDETRTAYPGGRTVMKTYSMAGVSGDTGGTLTCTGLKSLDNAVVSVYKAAAGVSRTYYISGNTVVVAYDDPTAAHTVRVTVWGLKG
jgi:hypothetical protein